MREEEMISQIKSLERQLHQTIVSNSHIAPNLARAAVTSVLCQMIAALPEPGRSEALEVAIEAMPEGVDVFSDDDEMNPFTLKERRFDA